MGNTLGEKAHQRMHSTGSISTSSIHRASYSDSEPDSREEQSRALVDKPVTSYEPFAPQHHSGGPYRALLQPWTIIVGLLLLSLAGSLYFKWDTITVLATQTPAQDLHLDPSVLLREFYATIKPAVTQASVTVANGNAYTIAGDALWTKPLGKEVLILDMDTRDLHGENQILNDEPVGWENLEQGSSGLLNHYMYCRLPYAKTRPLAAR